MKITGYVDVSALSAAMQAMPASIRKNVRREMKRAAEIVVERARQLAPVDTGWMKWHTITSRPAQYNKGKTMNDMIYEIHVNAEYAGYQEYGTSHNRAHPFLRPAISQTKEEVMRIIQEAMAEGIQESLRTSGLSFSAANVGILDAAILV